MLPRGNNMTKMAQITLCVGSRRTGPYTWEQGMNRLVLLDSNNATKIVTYLGIGLCQSISYLASRAGAKRSTH